MPFDFTTGLQDITNFNMNLEDVSVLKGDPGISAYQVAVNNGFEGTEKEWLESLRGEDGVDEYDDSELIARIESLEVGGMAIEKGTWTPTLVAESGTDPTYEMPYHYAMYYRMGDMVYITFYLKANISDAGSGFARIEGLPFTSAKGVGPQGLIQHIMDASSATSTSANIPAETSWISVRSYKGTGSVAWKSGSVYVGYSGWYLKK